MAEGKKCCIYLPNDRKLELSVQSKHLARDLLEIVAAHFKLREKEYFGIAYKSDSGHYSWLQADKLLFDHDVVKKSSSRIDLLFAVKFFVENVKLLKSATTAELYFLYLKSLVYKGHLEVDNNTEFRLAAFVLQTYYGDYKDADTAIRQLRKSSVLSNKVLRDFTCMECENAVLKIYKDLKDYSIGKAITSYLTTIETVPTYGVHYFKVKDKGGTTWLLGLSYKGIHQYDVHDKVNPVKSFSWQQLENLYFRERKFSIEVNDKHQRTEGLFSKEQFGDARRKVSSEVKVHAWYGSPALIKSIWVMAIDQHHFYLQCKQSKVKRHASNSIVNLSNDITANRESLINVVKDSSELTRKQIRNLDVMVKKGSKDEAPEMRAAKCQMLVALKKHKTDLEDRLYDKVQELKQVCLKEADLTGRLPQEYIHYMDPDEKQPKINKRIGAEFKVKLTNKEKGFRSSVSTAISSSPSLNSENSDDMNNLAQLETEFELLTQIANAAKKLASDPNTKGRTRTKRLGSYKKTLEKLQVVENKINVVRNRCGQKPSVRASTLETDQCDDILFEDGGISLREETESERSSLSDALLLDDDTSLSSGGDALSTHSTPVFLNLTHPPHPSSAMSGIKESSAEVDNDNGVTIHRSLTPPPSFERTSSVGSSKNEMKNGRISNQSISSSHCSLLNSKQQNVPIRNWIRLKWEHPRTKVNRGWHESSLDSIDADSNTGRNSEEHLDQDIHDEKPRIGSSDADVTPLGYQIDLRPNKLLCLDYNQPSNLNSNDNNHKTRDLGLVYDMSKLKREISDSALSELSVQSNPVTSSHQFTVRPQHDVRPKDYHRSESLVGKETRIPGFDHIRKRSSSFTESPTHTAYRTNSKAIGKNKARLEKRTAHMQKNLNQDSNFERHHSRVSSDASSTNISEHNLDNQSNNSQDLQPAMFDTNLNIRMQYLTRSSSQLSFTLPSSKPTTAVAQSSQPTTFEEQPLYVQQPRISQLPKYSSAQPHYAVSSNSRNITQTIPNMHRDALNNQVYRDIGMGWVPSLHEYGSRESVVESASAQYKKEDIQRMLKDHIATKRILYGSSQKIKNPDTTQIKHEKNWPDYQTHLQTSSSSTIPSTPRMNFYHLPTHTSYPVIHHQHPLPQNNTLQNIHPHQQGMITDNKMKQRLVLQHYIHHNPHNKAIKHVRTDPLVAYAQYSEQNYFTDPPVTSSNQQDPLPHHMTHHNVKNVSKEANQYSMFTISDKRKNLESWRRPLDVKPSPHIVKLGQTYNVTNLTNQQHQPDLMLSRPKPLNEQYKHSKKKNKSLSASAEDLLWSESSEGQEGTLV
uniref:Uncharacterized LOC100175529 n=1 Tax=Ciona intestinalis TaxID=7719 RepID=F6T9L2_CIOIN|nr:uncharacterized protein LOC100175529 isoform X1 [Ciona intestinalis]|eukprot:XP_002126530.1 uncharacterized protein LOC100175529 isoform X1 [Ciona intestinalis]